MHEKGIRSPFWFEEVFNDRDTQFFEITEREDKLSIYAATGFARNSYPIKYIFERKGDIICSLYGRIATKEEVKEEFCKYCTD